MQNEVKLESILTSHGRLELGTDWISICWSPLSTLTRSDSYELDISLAHAKAGSGIGWKGRQRVARLHFQAEATHWTVNRGAARAQAIYRRGFWDVWVFIYPDNLTLKGSQIERFLVN